MVNGMVKVFHQTRKNRAGSVEEVRADEVSIALLEFDKVQKIIKAINDSSQNGQKQSI